MAAGGKDVHDLSARAAVRRRVEVQLRDILVDRAVSVPAERDPYGNTSRGLYRARRRRWLAGVVSLFLVAAVAVSVAVFRPFREVPLEGWGVRGNLAAREEFLEAMADEAAQWSVLHTTRDDEVEHSRVVYAQDNGQLRWVVTVTQLVGTRQQRNTRAESRTAPDFARTQLVLFSGMSGAKPHDLTQRVATVVAGDVEALPPGYSSPTVPSLAWAHEGYGGQTRLFVLGPPDTRAIAYSPHPDFHADGTWTRSWDRVRSHDGVAFVAVQSSGMRGLVRLRLPHETAIVRSQPLHVASARGEFPRIVGFPPAGRRSVPPPQVFSAVFALGRHTGIPLGRFAVELQWHSAERNAWLLSATLPGGAVFQVVAAGMDREVALVPHGETERPIAVVFFVEHPRVLVVALGHEGASVELHQDGETLATAPVDETSSAVFDGRAAMRAARAGDTLRFRIVDNSGRTVCRGEVHTESRPPWTRLR